MVRAAKRAELGVADNQLLIGTGAIGLIALCVVQVGLAVVLGARVTKMKSGTARVMFYVYAALIGLFGPAPVLQ